MSQKILKVAGYARVSTDEQKKFGYSINAQAEAIDKWCADKGYNLEKIYIDEGFSASNMKRPALQEMLDNLKQLDAIIFTRLDRLSRNVLEANKMLELFNKHKVAMIAIAEDNIDTRTANGMFVFNLKVNLAEHELRKGSERIKSVFEYKVKGGQPISGKVPRGYKIAQANGAKRLVKDETEAEWVQETFDFFLVHQSIRATMRHINAKYNIDKGYQVYERILKNRIYTGEYRGNMGFTEPYISAEQYDNIQEFIRRNIRTRKDKIFFMFTGVIPCPRCGRILVGASKYHAQYDRRYYYYRCPRYYLEGKCDNAKHISEMMVEKHLLDNIDILLTDYIAEVERIKPVKLDDVDKRINAIKAEMDNLNYIFMKKRIDVAEYDRLFDDLETQLKRLQKPQADKKDVKALREFLNSGWRQIYDKMPREKRRALWCTIIKRIRATNAGVDEVEFL